MGKQPRKPPTHRKSPPKEPKRRLNKPKPKAKEPEKQVSVFDVKEYALPRHHKRKPICKKHHSGFESWTEYNKHLIEKHGHQQEYKCKACGTVCHSLQAYNTHQLKHEEDKKKHQCKECLKKFSFPSQLKTHMRTHKDDKKYTCPYKPGGVLCGKSFKYPETYKRHMKTHDGEEISCTHPGCPRTFTSMHYMKDHFRLQHSEPLQCKYVLSGCDYHTRSRASLINHEKFFCDFRPQVSTSQDSD